MTTNQPTTDSAPEYTRNAGDLPPGESSMLNAPTSASDSDGEQAEDADKTLGEDSWLVLKAREIYADSTDYLDSNIATQWEKNLSHFRSEHAPGSAFNTKNFKRSRMFRPKTRANVKKQEAALAVAMFSTADVADVQPANRLDETQVLSAAINKTLLEYRLNRKMPWMLTVLGAWQDTKNYGVCISHQYWRYQVDTDVVPALDDAGALVMGEDENGAETPMGRERKVVRYDELCCDNIPPENFRFSPMADWRDPVGSSPYVVYLKPMYVSDVLEQMEKEDPKTKQPVWRPYKVGEILATRREGYDRTRQAREGSSRVDPIEEASGNAQTTVWAHLNMLRVNGEDMAWWTLGTELVLTDAEPAHKMYPQLLPGQRPFVFGFSTVETHRNYPAGDVEQTTGLQEELNIIVNQRIDNVKLALNKRYYVRRGSQIDLDALIRNVPGGGVFMSDPERDIKAESFQDVTSSSYQEQDRMSLEFDDLAGSVSQQSMQQQGGMDAVGKANMVSQGANMIQDYGIMLFRATWLEPVLRQLLKLIQMYETDETLLALAGDKLQVYQRYGKDAITDSLLMQDLNLRVNVGMGNTDPVRKVERLVYGVSKIMEIPGMAQRVKASKIADEICGSLGYQDSSIFFLTDDEAEKLAQENPPQDPPEIAVKKLELEIRKADNDARHEREATQIGVDKELKLMEIASRENVTIESLRQRLGIETMRDKTTRESVALKERNRLTEATIQRAVKPQGKAK